MSLGQWSPDFPTPTDFHTRCTRCGVTLSYVDDIKATFCNHYELGSFLPIVVLALIFTGYANVIIFHIEFDWAEHWFILLEAFVMLIYCASYLNIIIEGPGYLPYYYPYQASDPHGISGVVSNREQLTWVRSQEHPLDVHFFRKARRLVIRADHYCFWTSCFIGRRNFKLFCLFNVWGLIFTTGYTLWNCVCLRHKWQSFEYPYTVSGSAIFGYLLISLIISVSFLAFHCTSLISNWMVIKTNLTVYENMKGLRPREPSSTLENCEYFFGSRNAWHTYLFPCSAFSNVPDTDLVNHVNNDLYYLET